MARTISAHRPVDRAEEILTPGALAFIEGLHQRFAATRLATPDYGLVG